MIAIREKTQAMTIAMKVTQAAASRAARMREATDRKIMQATLQIATSRGIGAVTIEEVARRSGVAKTTIYRRYRNTGDLLHKIQIETSSTFEVDDLAPTRSDLHCLLDRVAAAFNGEIGLKAVGLVLSSDNDYVKGLANQVIAPAEQRFYDYIRRGVEAGSSSTDSIWSFCSAQCWDRCWPTRRCRSGRPASNLPKSMPIRPVLRICPVPAVMLVPTASTTPEHGPTI